MKNVEATIFSKAPFRNRMPDFDARFLSITGNPNYHHMPIEFCEFMTRCDETWVCFVNPLLPFLIHNSLLFLCHYPLTFLKTCNCIPNSQEMWSGCPWMSSLTHASPESADVSGIQCQKLNLHEESFCQNCPS
jgi:hypothetical protein